VSLASLPSPILPSNCGTPFSPGFRVVIHEDGHSQRVFQMRCTGSLRLAAKLFQGLRFLRQILRQELQSDEAAQLGVFRFVDNTHPATAELLDDAVMRNNVAEEGIPGWACAAHLILRRQATKRDTKRTRSRRT
jgi:hypothetical protein